MKVMIGITKSGVRLGPRHSISWPDAAHEGSLKRSHIARFTSVADFLGLRHALIGCISCSRSQLL